MAKLRQPVEVLKSEPLKSLNDRQSHILLKFKEPKEPIQFELTYVDFKLEKGPTDKAKEPDPGGSDQQNLEFKKLKNRKTDRTVGLNCCSVF